MPARGPKLVGLNTWPWIWSSALYSSTEPHLCPAAHEYNIRAAYAEHRRAGTWRRVDTWSANTYSVLNSVRIAEFGIGRGRPGGRGHIADARGRAEKASFKLRAAGGRPAALRPGSTHRAPWAWSGSADGDGPSVSGPRSAPDRICAGVKINRGPARAGPWRAAVGRGRHISDTAYGRAARRASE